MASYSSNAKSKTSVAGKAIARGTRGKGDPMLKSIGKTVSGAAGNNRASRKQATATPAKGSGVGSMMKQGK